MSKVPSFVMAVLMTFSSAVIACAREGSVSAGFSRYRASSPANGSLYLYLKNDTPGPVSVDRIYLDGEEIEKLREQESVAWHRVRPEVLGPGESGEVLVRFSALPRNIAMELFFDDKAVHRMKVELVFSDGSRLSEEAEISLSPEPFQVNFIGFGENLDKLYLYLQNNGWVLSGREEPVRVERVYVNGRDLTRRSRFGSRVLEGNVVPVEVTLEEPLERGAPAVVVAEAAGGLRAGHTLRAFPSEMMIQTCFFRQIREDSVRDVDNHCFTAIDPFRSSDYLRQAKSLGIGAFLYVGWGGVQLELLEEFSGPEFPEIKGMWLDEIDKVPAPDAWRVLKEAKEFFKEREGNHPPYTLNLLGGRTAAGGDYLEMGDAVTDGYGVDPGRLGGRNFAGFDSLHEREYRLSRRPFWPYFRNTEMGLEVEEGTDRIIGPSPIRPYPMHPEEERWRSYGTLMQGAKGILHWGYGVWKRPPPNWFSRERHALRIGMGGMPGKYAYGYRIPDEIAEDLRETWREIGRINAELRTVGDVVARSDVCSRARITSVNPAEGAGFHDERSAEVATLVSGLDTMVVIVLNMNIDTHWRSGFREREDRVRAYPPADATVEVEVPGWLRARDFFTVSHEGIERMRPKRTGRNLLEFEFPGIEVSRVLVITSDRGLYRKMSGTLAGMRERLARVETDEPVPIPGRTSGREGPTR